MKENLTESRYLMQGRVCQNSNFKYNGNHCPSCGQKYLEDRFSFTEFIGCFFDKLFNNEEGFFKTVQELTFNINEMLTKYLRKAAVGYMHPFRFVFLMATISAILNVFSGTFESSSILQFSVGFAEGWNNYEPQAERESIQMLKAVEILETIKKYFAFILLFNIPLYALRSFLIYYKHRYNFTEHLILNCYALGLSLLLGIPLYLLILAEEGLIIYFVINLLLTYLTFALVYRKFFKENLFFSLLKTLIVYVFLVFIISIIVLVRTDIEQSISG